MGPGLTRRTLLRRSAVAVAALAAASTGMGLLRGAASPARLAPARRRTYAALVDAVGRGSRSQVDPARAGAAADWLAADYADALEPRRAAIDDVLDRLERATPAGPFSALHPAARIAALRALAGGSDAAGANLAGRAVALAAVPFHPPPDEYHPTPVAL